MLGDPKFFFLGGEKTQKRVRALSPQISGADVVFVRLPIELWPAKSFTQASHPSICRFAPSQAPP